MSADLPAGPFDVVYADPPWQYDFSKSASRTIENQYVTMTTADVCALRIPAAENAVLYLWGVAPKVPEALDVMRAWGFDYRSCAVWDKRAHGMGYWWRGQHELLFVGVKGKWSPPPPALRESSVIYCKRGKHSSKPAQVRDSITRYWPDARRLEMFGRYPVPGWTVWGNQADGDPGALPFEEAS